MTTNTEWAYSADGLTAQPRGRRLPRTITLDDGRIVTGLTPDRAAEFGWYPLRRETAQIYGDGLAKIATVIGDEAVLQAVVPDDIERRARALAALEWRITAHRDRLVAIATTGLAHDDNGMGVDMMAVQKAQLTALMQANLLNLKVAEGTATPDDIATIDVMAGIPVAIHAIDVARASLLAWATDQLATWQAVHDLDPANPPPEAPQWPNV